MVPLFVIFIATDIRPNKDSQELLTVVEECALHMGRPSFTVLQYRISQVPDRITYYFIIIIIHFIIVIHINTTTIHHLIIVVKLSVYHHSNNNNENMI